jgi:hypothetical protein
MLPNIEVLVTIITQVSLRTTRMFGGRSKMTKERPTEIPAGHYKYKPYVVFVTHWQEKRSLLGWNKWYIFGPEHLMLQNKPVEVHTKDDTIVLVRRTSIEATREAMKRNGDEIVYMLANFDGLVEEEEEEEEEDDDENIIPENTLDS